MLDTSGKEPADTVAEARAAQILSEMLGMVCHPEYFQNPPRDQTVIPIPIPAILHPLTFLSPLIGHRCPF